MPWRDACFRHAVCAGIDVARIDSDVWNRVQELRTPLARDASMTPGDGFSPWTADSLGIGESLYQRGVVDFPPNKVDMTKELQSPFASRFARLFLHVLSSPPDVRAKKPSPVGY